MAVRVTKRRRLVQKKRKRRLMYSFVCVIFLVIAYAGIGWGLTHKSMDITKVTIFGNEMVSAEQLESTVRHGLAVTRGLFLYGGTVLTYDEKAIKKDLLYTHPRLKSVDIKIDSLHTLEILVTEREAVAQWCEDVGVGLLHLEVELPSCYLVDKDGFIFERLKTQQEGLVFYMGDLGGDVLRQTLLHGDFAEVDDFVEGLRDIGIEPTVVHLMGGEAEIESLEHPTLRIKLDERLKRTHSYIEVTLNSQEYKEMSENEGGVEYIDVRFGNRVYYK